MKRLLFLFLLWPAVALAADADGSQVSCLTASAVTVGTATGRMSLCMKNTDATNPVYVNQAGTTAGFPIAAGDRICVDAQAGSTGPYTAETTIKCRSTGGTVVLGIWQAWR